MWLRELGNPYALSLFDGEGMLGLDLGVYGAPETFLIDGNGVIRYRHAGAMDERVWEKNLNPFGSAIIRRRTNEVFIGFIDVSVKCNGDICIDRSLYFR